jgi:hypothetical protein
MVLTRKGPGRADLAAHPLIRAAQAVGAAAFTLGSLGSGDPFWLAGTAVCLLGVLSEDRWILDSGKRLIRRRFGILPAPRSFDLDWEEIEAVFVETVERPSAEDLAARADDLRSLYPRLVGKGSRGWAAWGFILAGGRDLTVRAEAPAREESIRAQAGAVAELLGREFRGR